MSNKRLDLVACRSLQCWDPLLHVVALSNQAVRSELLFFSPRVFSWSCGLLQLGTSSYSHAQENHRGLVPGDREEEEMGWRRKSRFEKWRLWSGRDPAHGVRGNPRLSLLPPTLFPGIQAEV